MELLTMPRALAPRKTIVLALGCALLGLGLCGSAHAAERLYVLSIGNNQPLRQDPSGEPLDELSYADDDAAAVYEFFGPLATRATLLTVLDRASQRRFVQAAQAATAPTLAELSRVVGSYAAAMEQDRREGHSPTFVFFFSGHGSRTSPDGGVLHLLDGGLTQSVLYDQVLARLPAKYAHVIVDACHAEAVVRPRDGGSREAAPATSSQPTQVVAVSPGQAQRFLAAHTLRRFPHVGSVTATSFGQRAHEWDEYEQGIFTHQVLSGLRGAADVNQDRKIEYSELHAFLSAANRAIENPRARLSVLVQPPRINLRVPLVDLSRSTLFGWLRGQLGALGHFYVEDLRGVRLLDAHLEPGPAAALWLPPHGVLYLRSARGEARFRIDDAQPVTLSQLDLRPSHTRARGALDSAFKRGLFVSQFGPRYYEGFVDRVGDVTVELGDAPTVEDVPAQRPGKLPAYVAFGTAAACTVATAVFAGLALKARSDWQDTDVQRTAMDAESRYTTYRTALLISAGAAAAAGATGLLLYPFRTTSKPPAFAVMPTTVGSMMTFRGSF